MSVVIRIRTTVLPGHRIEIQSPDLPEGSDAVVLVTVDEGPKRRLADILGDYPGGRLFATGSEVDEFLRAERDSWDK